MTKKKKKELFSFEVYHKGKDRWILFQLCEDIRDAKTRFQWRYGYWPIDEEVRPFY